VLKNEYPGEIKCKTLAAALARKIEKDCEAKIEAEEKT
jgi:hypothetical protein